MLEVNSTVTYKDIQGFPGYRVGSDGTVWSSRVKGDPKQNLGKVGPWKLASLHRRPYGSRYVVVCLRAVPGGRVSCHYVHRLVLEAFIGSCPEGMECRHFPDRDTSNNRLENLSWGTNEQNKADKKVHVTQTSGIDHPTARFTDDDIEEMKRLRATGMTQAAIGAIFKANQSYVSSLLSGKRRRALAKHGVVKLREKVKT